jgi:hypothetical protein
MEYARQNEDRTASSGRKEGFFGTAAPVETSK